MARSEVCEGHWQPDAAADRIDCATDKCIPVTSNFESNEATGSDQSTNRVDCTAGKCIEATGSGEVVATRGTAECPVYAARDADLDEALTQSAKRTQCSGLPSRCRKWSFGSYQINHCVSRAETGVAMKSNVLKTCTSSPYKH